MNFLTATWSNLVMANYEIDPEILKPYLPWGTELDYHHGKTYISLVGFMFLQTKLFGLPIPGLRNFEEINLRFYVCRKEKNTVKRGVVFINETVPYRAVAWLANKLYKEHYTAMPTTHSWRVLNAGKRIEYRWKSVAGWNFIQVDAESRLEDMTEGSMEAFIFEHYYGYTRLSAVSSEEYHISHARWQTHRVERCSVDCDFSALYGPDFAFLRGLAPSNVLLAAGSPVAVKWHRIPLRAESHKE